MSLCAIAFKKNMKWISEQAVEYLKKKKKKHWNVKHANLWETTNTATHTAAAVFFPTKHQQVPEAKSNILLLYIRSESVLVEPIVVKVKTGKATTAPEVK